jgi:hypothetical protein
MKKALITVVAIIVLAGCDIELDPDGANDQSQTPAAIALEGTWRRSFVMNDEGTNYTITETYIFDSSGGGNYEVSFSPQPVGWSFARGDNYIPVDGPATWRQDGARVWITGGQGRGGQFAIMSSATEFQFNEGCRFRK